MSHTRVCSCCGKRVEVEGKRTRYTFICEDCLDEIDDFTEPVEQSNDIESYYPEELNVGILV